MENREIERKFLVNDNSYRKSAYTHYDIIQGYICKEPGRTIRIRLRTDADGTQQAYITIKSRMESITRFEWEKPITVADFQALLPLCGNRVISKVRYLVAAAPEPLKREIDEFRMPNPGLVMAEIELPAEDTSFECPPFIGKEVTHDARYYNANMI